MQSAFKIIFGFLKALHLHNLSECALLIYWAVYLAKGILIMFQSVMYHLQEYLCKILLAMRIFIRTKTYIYVPAKLIGGGGAGLLGLVLISSVVM